MRLLAKGSEADSSRIVYSTCSLNPVENEAVVAAALNSVPGTIIFFTVAFTIDPELLGFEIVDVAEHLPELIRRPGLSAWRPAVNIDVAMPFATYADYSRSFEDKASETPLDEGQKERKKGNDQGRKRLQETHWPPSNASSLGLERW